MLALGIAPAALHQRRRVAEHDADMIDRFITSVRALATMSPLQLGDRDGRELVAECADALRLELDCPQQDFTARQRQTLRALDDALASGSVTEVRSAAAATCAVLGIEAPH